MTVTPHTLIEDIVETIPSAVNYLSEKGIRCIICGDAIWGTLSDAAREKGFTDQDIKEFANELNKMQAKP